MELKCYFFPTAFLRLPSPSSCGKLYFFFVFLFFCCAASLRLFRPGFSAVPASPRGSPRPFFFNPIAKLPPCDRRLTWAGEVALPCLYWGVALMQEPLDFYFRSVWTCCPLSFMKSFRDGSLPAFVSFGRPPRSSFFDGLEQIWRECLMSFPAFFPTD